jgi:hypothetical protein
VDADVFDTLVRKFVRGVSRRRVFGGLVTGVAANVVAERGTSARDSGVTASRKRNDGKVAICHRKRTKRVLPAALNVHLDHGDKLGRCGKTRRKHRHKSDENTGWRGFSLLLINPNTSNSSIHVVCGDPKANTSNSCNQMASYDLDPGAARLFVTSSHNAYCWVQDRYWIVFSNPLIGLPDGSVAVGGSGPDYYGCYRFSPTRVFMTNRSFKEGEEFKAVDPTSDPVNTFWILRRNDEDDYKQFWVIMPSNW